MQLLRRPVARATAGRPLADLDDAARDESPTRCSTGSTPLARSSPAPRPPRRWSRVRRHEDAARIAPRDAARTALGDPAPARTATVLAAGTQVPIAAGAWLLVALAERPELQQRLASGEVEPTCVVWEVLRLTPPTWVTARVARPHVNLAGVRIPEGGVVLVSPLLLGRLADLVPSEDGEAVASSRIAYGRSAGRIDRDASWRRGCPSGWARTLARDAVWAGATSRAHVLGHRCVLAAGRTGRVSTRPGVSFPGRRGSTRGSCRGGEIGEHGLEPGAPSSARSDDVPVPPPYGWPSMSCAAELHFDAALERLAGHRPGRSSRGRRRRALDDLQPGRRDAVGAPGRAGLVAAVATSRCPVHGAARRLMARGPRMRSRCRGSRSARDSRIVVMPDARAASARGRAGRTRDGALPRRGLAISTSLLSGGDHVRFLLRGQRAGRGVVRDARRRPSAAQQRVHLPDGGGGGPALPRRCHRARRPGQRGAAAVLRRHRARAAHPHQRHPRLRRGAAERRRGPRAASTTCSGWRTSSHRCTRTRASSSAPASSCWRSWRTCSAPPGCSVTAPASRGGRRGGAGRRRTGSVRPPPPPRSRWSPTVDPRPGGRGHPGGGAPGPDQPGRQRGDPQPARR